LFDHVTPSSSGRASLAGPRRLVTFTRLRDEQRAADTGGGTTEERESQLGDQNSGAGKQTTGHG
ncbi:hypothetical protein BaRGS_00014957, partial [Batillaria attramentaria]